MGCSHSVREEKVRFRKKRQKVDDEHLTTAETKPKDLGKKIVLKSVTSTRKINNQGDDGNPHDIEPNKDERSKRKKSINPYAMNRKTSYGYPVLFNPGSSKKMVVRQQEN